MRCPPRSTSSRSSHVADWLRALAPERARRCSPPTQQSGHVLLEDLGDDLFSRVLAARRRRGAALSRPRSTFWWSLQRAPPPDRLPPTTTPGCCARPRCCPSGTRRHGPGRSRLPRDLAGPAAGGAGRRRRLRLRRLPRRQPALAARARGPRPGRPARLPGRAPRAAGLRPGLAARGCAARRAARARADAMVERYLAARPELDAGRLPAPPTRCSAPSATPRSWGCSRASRGATASPPIWRCCRASPAISKRDLEHPLLAPLARLVRPSPAALARISH